MDSIQKHIKYFKGKPQENQIGCGYCKKEDTCIIKEPMFNKAKEGCEKFIHHERKRKGNI